jgi:hypothetical protein
MRLNNILNKELNVYAILFLFYFSKLYDLKIKNPKTTVYLKTPKTTTLKLLQARILSVYEL